MSFTPPVDFLKYLNGVIGVSANLVALPPMEYNYSSGILTIDNASATQSGCVTTGAQTFSGVKTFADGIIGNITTNGILNTTANTSIQTTNAGDSYFNFKADPTSAYDNEIRIYGLGDESSTNSESIQIGYNTPNFEISTNKQGSGVKKDLHFDIPSTRFDSTMDSTSTDSGAVQLLGGMAISKKLFTGSTVDINEELGNPQIVMRYHNNSYDEYVNMQCTANSDFLITPKSPASSTIYVNGKLNVNNSNTEAISTTGGGRFYNGMRLCETGGALTVLGTIQSTSTQSGCAIFSGGVGIAGNIYVGGTVHTLGGAFNNNTSESTSTSTGAFVIEGGVGIGKRLNVGGIINGPEIIVTSTNESTSPWTGALQVSGGAGIAKNLGVGGNMYAFGTSNAQIVFGISTDDATSASTGSLRSWGGASIAKSLYVGGGAKILSTTEATNYLSGSLTVDGGVGIAKRLYVGTTIYSGISVTAQHIYAISTLDATDVVTGGLHVNGGAGIIGNIYVGGANHVESTANSTSINSGAIQTLGGIGVTKDIYVGGAVTLNTSMIIKNNGGLNSNSIYTDASNNILLGNPRWKIANMMSLLKGSGASPGYTLIGALPFYAYEFTTAQTLSLYGQLHLPGDVYGSSPQYVIVLHWMTNSNNVGNVHFIVTFNQAIPGTAHSPPDTALNMIVPSTGQYVNNRNMSAAYTMNNIIKGTQALLKISRSVDVSDTLNASIWLTGFYYMYQADKLIGDSGA